MADVIISACGFRCDLCPAYFTNITGPADQQATAAGWKRYYDIDMQPETIVCEGCRSVVRPGRELPARECATRDCVSEKRLVNCGRCESYPCERRESLMAELEGVFQRYEAIASRGHREKFFVPCDARKNFEEMR
jgi:hypothetical protein